ncbi:Enoyl-[acyl-carrier-protein] reductase [NADH] FabI [Candidatus Rubidus massiliensis]|nr:MAG: hypothetical protein BGO10_00985 [Chlamydia sp. 32-24]CDZ81513.1 Enoyl-[acyl-carrier-protein] reductase [NADH] FabI [Candidatus Rubidus massiliensis]
MKKVCEGQNVLITGGTRGFGKALALAFLKAGANNVFITHKWGSVDENTLIQEFKEAGVKSPIIITSDIGNREDTDNLMKKIEKVCQEGLDVIISNVAVSKMSKDLSDWKRNSLEISIRYSAWSIVDLVQAHEDVFKKFPKYLIGISSDGPDLCHPGYSIIGIAKAALETICRYLAMLLKDQGCIVNILRPGYFATESSKVIFGEDVFKKNVYNFLNIDKAANVCLALCSGLMDGVIGQTIVVDEGQSLISPVTYLQIMNEKIGVKRTD